VVRQVAVVLRKHGWTGRARPCGPNCTALGFPFRAPTRTKFPKGVPLRPELALDGLFGRVN
jgi:hypothetical protein